MEDIKAAIENHGLGAAFSDLDDACLQRVRQYAVLLWLKNQQMNLTRHTTWDQFVTRDLLDTVELSGLVPAGSEVLDVGTGGGVPGLLLAILRPDLKLTLTDSVGKKAAALGEFAAALELDVEIYNERAETVLEDLRFDVTTARAVGPLIKICRWFEGHWPSVGRLLATKGPKWPEELEQANESGLTTGIKVTRLKEYATPGTEWKSVILELRVRPETS